MKRERLDDDVEQMDNGHQRIRLSVEANGTHFLGGDCNQQKFMLMANNNEDRLAFDLGRGGDMGGHRKPVAGK